MSSFPYGTVLKIEREHSPDDVRRLLEEVRSLGMSLVVIWPAVYWWEDRGNPGYPYETGRAILRNAERIGLQVIMELAGQITSLEYAPDFLMKPEYFATRRDGTARRASVPSTTSTSTIPR